MTNYVLEDDEFRSFLKTLGTRIKLLRTSKGIQMRDIMIKAGYYDAQWRKYEAGGSLNLSSLMKIALVLEVTLTELLDGLGQWPRLSVTQIRSRNEIALDSEFEPEPEPESKRARLQSRIPGATNTAKQPMKRTVEKVAKGHEARAGRNSKAAVPARTKMSTK